MLFIGPELLDVLGRSSDEIQLRTQYGRCSQVLSGDDALVLNPSLFVGIGNRWQVRFLRPLELGAVLSAGCIRRSERTTDST
jgi:hypothetical protein